ncbi:hypothetical protein CDV31_014092 [Fusarium ambrosium]|uniref:Clr5 domain-containing protein n=1 Tax=Fusarium ambrosium TaxID=131363 RepID=A0A428SYV0_9HYPO|nr:hypothetical protein CDV31_014092 [Fusarium ambrosium]
MDPSLIGPLPQSDDEKFLSCSYEDRWSCLKPVIVEIYTRRRNGRTATLDQVVQFMRTQYSFHAAPTEYRRRFRDWGVSKRMVKEDKDAITSALVRKKRPAASVSDATTQHDGKDNPLDYKKLKRHLISRKPCLKIAPGLLSSWNLPYAAFISSLPKNPGEPSPFGPLGSTPDYLHIKSSETFTSSRAADNPSPRMQLVYEKHKEHCTSLFMQGRLKQLVVGMSKEDRSTMVNYFHDFYMYSFVLAKNWGWELLDSSPTQATWNAASPWTEFVTLSPGPSPSDVLGTTNISSPPTQLCKWSIHVAFEPYEDTADEQVTLSPGVVPQPDSEPLTSTFVETLHQSMVSNDFTTTPKADLPLAQDMIARSLEQDSSPLQLDACKLAIMAGNMQLLYQLYEDNGEDLPEGIEAIHPFHLAAAFLDGGHQCCEVFTTLADLLPPIFAFSHNTDDFGHTILDALLVSVLRSHTSIHPDTVSYGFHSPNRFPGEEKDICGRWDADTPTVRELFKQGYARIPTKWKHPFCHTAVQAVCHSIITIFASPASPDINTPSGLFVRRCTECGLELKLGPLHTLVVTAFYLAQLGMQGETLFGALAVMLCLLALGANVDLKVDVSVDEILSSSDAGRCRHTRMSALDLMRAVPLNVIEAWSENCQIGWSCLVQVLTVVMVEDLDGCPETPMSSSSESSDHHSCEDQFQEMYHDFWLKLPCNGPRTGLLWASVQTELLTYRRVREGDSWISENFSMDALKTWLEGDSPEFATPLVQNRMFKVPTRCGWFYDVGDFLCPTVQQVCSDYFMNMDIHGRASYIRQPDLLESFENVEHVGDRKI